MFKSTQLCLYALFAGTTAITCAGEPTDPEYAWVPVSGTGTHLFSTAKIHSVRPTDTGIIQRSTDIVELEGDLKGTVLYHPVSEFDFAMGTLVNTGDQVFSGTILGSEPVLIHDETFRFEVDLASGETLGLINLLNPMAGPDIRCELEATSTGVTENLDPILAYTGRCRVRL